VKAVAATATAGAAYAFAFPAFIATVAAFRDTWRAAILACNLALRLSKASTLTAMVLCAKATCSNACLALLLGAAFQAARNARAVLAFCIAAAITDDPEDDASTLAETEGLGLVRAPIYSEQTGLPEQMQNQKHQLFRFPLKR
jgi:hypothetical protein